MTAAAPGDALITIGEIHTALLRSSAALSLPACRRLVSFSGVDQVMWHERPIAHVVSPRVLTGIDCRPPAVNGTRARVIGTLDGRVAVTGGHVIQSVVRTRIVPDAGARRRSWSHYLARPGDVELVGRLGADDLATGFLQLDSDAGTLDLGAVCARLINGIQAHPSIDGRMPFKAARTKFRWLLLPPVSEAPSSTTYRIDSEGLRTLVIRSALDHRVIDEFAADIALHDWLLTALLDVIERSRIGLDDHPTIIARLRPAVEYLLHLWMPAARSNDAAVDLWSGLERRPGLTRQWQTAVSRIRDQLAMGAVTALSGRLEGTVLEEAAHLTGAGQPAGTGRLEGAGRRKGALGS